MNTALLCLALLLDKLGSKEYYLAVPDAGTISLLDVASEACLQIIMVSVFIILDWTFVSMKTTTIIPYRRTS